jgi:hypothetical protein
MRVSASTAMISGYRLKPHRGIRCRCRAVGRINLASLYVMNAARDTGRRLIEVFVRGP